MLFNETVIKNKVKYLDAILQQEGLLRKVLNDFSRGQAYNYRLVERIWNPGGGASLFVVAIGKEKYFLKVKSVNLSVESKLEAEATFIQTSSLKHEFNFLQKVRDISSHVPQFCHYVEEDGWSFLFIEYLETFEAVADNLSATVLLQVYQVITETVHQLYDNNIVHTDIHENNIMFRGQSPVLVDFEEARIIAQDIPFEESLDVCGENAWGNVGYFPEGHSPVSGFTCLNRLKEVFKNLITSKLGDLIKECHFDSSCPFLTALDHGKDERIYQSINIPGLTIAGQRSLYDDRVAFILEVANKLFTEPFTHLDIGSNLGRFNLELGHSEKVRKSIGVEAYDKYVELSRVLAFLSDANNVEFIQAECGQDSLVELLRGHKIDLVTVYSVYHHIQNKAAFIKDLIALQPAYLLFEMPVQKECYEGRSWQEEISIIAQQMGMPYWYLLSHTRDYNRPIVLVSKKQLAPSSSKSNSALSLTEINCSTAEAQKLPLVSVVLPTYNHLKFLPQAIQSVLAQTFHNFELIIVNDGSTDGTKGYLDTLKDPRIHVLHQENKRLPGALNTGFQAAQGKLLTWISSDNYCAPIFLEALVSALNAFPEAGFAYSRFAWIDEQDRITQVSQNDNLTYRRLLASNPGLASFMYRRECHEKVGWYAPELEGAEDWDMWLRILEHYPVVHVPEILYYYRLHRQSMTAQIPDKVYRASRQVPLRALSRQNNELELTKLYPALALCQNQNLARLHAAFDFGTLLLQSPFIPPLLAGRVLETALAASPHSFEIMSNLAVAYGRSEQWGKTASILSELRTAEHPMARQVVELIETAYHQNKPELLVGVPLYSIDQTSTELFLLEQQQQHIFSITAAVSTPASPEINRASAPVDTATAMAGDTTWPIQVTTLVQQANHYFDQGNLNAAADSLSQALDIIPDDPRLIVALGNLWLHLGQLDAARREFIKATVLHPQYIPAHTNLAVVLLQLGFLDQAQVSARRALSLNPTEPETLKVWAQLCLKQEHYDEGIQTYVNILRDHPHDVEVLLALAGCYVEVENWASALQFYQHALQLSGDNPALAATLHETVSKLQALVKETPQEKMDCNGRPTSEQLLSSLAPASSDDLSNLDHPLVSVIVPTYNRPEMLKEALAGILRQTYQNFEIIVVNDAGVEAEHIVNSFNDKNNITYIRHNKNKGLAAARNTGIKIARGKYIALLDDDDLFYADHLETALKHLKGNTSVIYTDAVRATYEKHNDTYRLLYQSIPYSIDFDRRKLLLGNIAAVNCFVFERELAIKAGLFDETLTTLEDWDFWIKLSALTSFKHIPQTTVQVNWRTDGTTMTSSRSQEFQQNRTAIHTRYQNEIAQIPNIAEIMAAFGNIWRKDSQFQLPLTSIIILTHNGLDHTRLCLASLEAHTPQPHELIIVDNGSTDGTLDFLRDYQASHQNVRLIANAENLGFAAGNNQALAVAKGDYLLLLNNDTVVTEGWLARMLGIFERYPEVGLVGPMSNRVAGPQLVHEAAYQSLEAIQQFAASWADRHMGQTTEFFRLVGFCLLARRAVIDRIGGLDERFGKGNFEDDDFCLRAALAGFKARIAQDTFVHHTGSQTFKDIGVDYGQSLEQNWNIFKAKWDLPAHLPYGTNYLPYLTHVSANPPELFIPLPISNTQVKANLSNDPSQILAEGAAAVQRGDFETAAREFEAVTRQYPNLAAAYTALGLVLTTLNRLDEAAPALRRAAELVPHLAAAHNQLGVALYRLGQMAEAETAFQTARQVAPDDMESRLNLIDLYREQQRLADESALLKEALTLDPHHPEVLLSFGVLSLALGDVEGADLAWQRLQAAHPDHPGAAALAEALGQSNSKPVDVLHLLPQVEIAQAQGDWPQAIDLLQEMLQAGSSLNGEAAPLWNRLGYCRFMNQQWAEAEAAFQCGLELAPDNLDLLGNLADLHLGQEHFDRATHYLNRALQLDPNDVNTLLTLGNCSIQLGAFDTALLAFRRVETLAPQTSGVQQVLLELEALVAGETGLGIGM